MSRIEELLQKLLNGETDDVEAQSRVEAILKNAIEGRGIEGLPEPHSRLEAYLMAIAEKGVGGGGDIPAIIQALTVTENGTYEVPEGVDGYGPVVVEVASAGGGDIDALIDRSITQIRSRVTSIDSHAFRECVLLTTADFPVATSIGSNAFRDCALLTTVDFPVATSIYGSAFYGCYVLTTVNFPMVTSIDSHVFYGCYGLTTADFSMVTSIESHVFYNCSKLTTIVLRSETVAALSNKSAFTNTPIASGTGYIYVPKALIDTYKTAANWSTYAAQFRALEDYTVDGTTTGALDESKI